MEGRRRFHPLACIAFVTIALLATPAFGQSPHVGVRLGYDFDSEDVLLGSSITVPMTSRIDFFPSIDLYLPDEGSRTGFNGDLKYRFSSTGSTGLYMGGGLNVLTRHVGDFSDTDLGVNALLGLEERLGRVHPFIEGRVRIHDESGVLLIGGLNITFGR